MKNIAILGSTGSIGKNALHVAAMFPERFRVVVLSAKNNAALLAEQILSCRPEMVAVYDAQVADEVRERVGGRWRGEIACGEPGYLAAAAHSSADIVLSAMVGAAGLLPTLAAIDAGKTIALANKETLVMAGAIVMQRAREKRVQILPVDSEHSAIFQCLQGQASKHVEKLLLTASGGPFVDTPAERFPDIRPEDALRHPTWEMGRKISIDSATLMNKGLEVIEARWLFDMPAENIEVVVHPQSVIHSMVSFRDGSVLAQLSLPDMKGAISYALSYPERLPIGHPTPDFAAIGGLTFRAPDIEKFPCLGLAYSACRSGGTMPTVLNAANEISVEAFLNGRLAFGQIPGVIQTAMKNHEIVERPDLPDILSADRWARQAAEEEIARLQEKRS